MAQATLTLQSNTSCLYSSLGGSSIGVWDHLSAWLGAEDQWWSASLVWAGGGWSTDLLLCTRVPTEGWWQMGEQEHRVLELDPLLPFSYYHLFFYSVFAWHPCFNSCLFILFSYVFLLNIYFFNLKDFDSHSVNCAFFSCFITLINSIFLLFQSHLELYFFYKLFYSRKQLSQFSACSSFLLWLSLDAFLLHRGLSLYSLSSKMQL